jgi:hypothetical protein
MVSVEFEPRAPVQVTVATFEIVPAAVGTTVMVKVDEVAPAARVPTVHVTGPVPVQPVWETKEVPAGIASVMVTPLTEAAESFVAVRV